MAGYILLTSLQKMKYVSPKASEFLTKITDLQRELKVRMVENILVVRLGGVLLMESTQVFVMKISVFEKT